jgi:hypothetical protein
VKPTTQVGCFWTIAPWGAEVVAVALQILTANKPLSALLDNSLGDILVMKGYLPYFFTILKVTYRLFTIALGSSILD